MAVSWKRAGAGIRRQGLPIPGPREAGARSGLVTAVEWGPDRGTGQMF